MAQGQASPPSAGTKRGPYRTTRAAQPPLKKVKASETPQPSSPAVQTPATESPAPSRQTGERKLPTRLAEYRPLPTLPSPQPLDLATSTHQSLAESAVLYAALDRSRLRWVQYGVFDRYWTKPESGKNARPPPPNNPEAKWMKHRGPCRIRAEPHIFECEVYIEEKPRPPVQKVQHPPYHRGYGGYGYGQQYRPSHASSAYAPTRPFSPAQPPAPARPSAATTPHSTPQAQPEKRQGPDPVISMLAGRASSDPELKALMKEVATGAANPEQLKVFQRHIDELTKMINDKRKREEEEAAAAEAKKAQESIQYDGAADQRPLQPHQPYAAYSTPQHQASRPTPTPPPPPVIHAPTPPPPPSAPPVIFQFTTPGATEDRFLFPPNSIVENLSPQHLLCSTFIVRKAADAADPSSLPGSPTTEYFEPITFMIEVAYGRESLIELVKKHVRPAEEVRGWMEEIMARCTRAPDAFLAMRLPVNGADDAETEEETAEAERRADQEWRKRYGSNGFAGAGGGAAGERRGSGSGPNVKYVKKPGPKKGEGGRPVGVKNGEGGGKKAGAAAGKAPAALGPPTPMVAMPAASGAVKTQTPAHPDIAETAKDPSAGGLDVPASKPADGADASASVPTKAVETDAQAPTGDGDGRPKRTVRKSVRISDV